MSRDITTIQSQETAGRSTSSSRIGVRLYRSADSRRVDNDFIGPMTGASAWMMTSRWDVAHLLPLWAICAVMMTADDAAVGLAAAGYCVGCCWALMLLLFAGGVMNLALIAALTAFVALEKFVALSRRLGAAFH